MQYIFLGFTDRPYLASLKLVLSDEWRPQNVSKYFTLVYYMFTDPSILNDFENSILALYNQ